MESRPVLQRSKVALALAITGVLLLGLAGPTSHSVRAAASGEARSLAPDFGGGSAAAPQPRKISLGVPVTPPNMVHLAPYIAADQGYFQEVGLEVEFKNFEGGLQALRGGIAGGLDIAGTSADPIIAAATRPPLTTINMNLHELGRQAGLRMLGLIDGGRETGIVRLPCSLVVRQSCGQAGGAAARRPTNQPLH